MKLKVTSDRPALKSTRIGLGTILLSPSAKEKVILACTGVGGCSPVLLVELKTGFITHSTVDRMQKEVAGGAYDILPSRQVTIAIVPEQGD